MVLTQVSFGLEVIPLERRHDPDLDAHSPVIVDRLVDRWANRADSRLGPNPLFEISPAVDRSAPALI